MDYSDNDIAVGDDIRASDVTQLRARIQELRARAQLPPFSWTDPVITARQTEVRAVHFNDLRAALNQVYAARQLAVPTYAEAIVAQETLIRASHINELRDFVAAIDEIDAPLISPAGGLISPSTPITITADTNSEIRYTLDGTTPTESSPVYVAALTIPSNARLSARAFHRWYKPSVTTAADYQVAPGPTIAPAGGSFRSPVTVTITAVGAAQIRYTLDGSQPTMQSTEYRQPFPLAEPATLTARAFQSGVAQGSPTTATFNFWTPAPVFSPPPGVYVGTIAVTLSGQGGVRISYGANNLRGM